MKDVAKSGIKKPSGFPGSRRGTGLGVGGWGFGARKFGRLALISGGGGRVARVLAIITRDSQGQDVRR